MSRELLVVIHAGAGITGLVVGVAVFSAASAGGRKGWRIVYAGLLIVLFVSLVALIIRDWTHLETASRLTFTGLAILAGAMLIRIYLAHCLAASREPGWEIQYVNHVYFTYISLWVGFAIIPALRSPMPGLWIPIAVIAVLAVGSILVHRYQLRNGLKAT